MRREKMALYERLLRHTQLASLGLIMQGTDPWEIRNWRTAYVYTQVWHVHSPRNTDELLDFEIAWLRFLAYHQEQHAAPSYWTVKRPS